MKKKLLGIIAGAIIVGACGTKQPVTTYNPQSIDASEQTAVTQSEEQPEGVTFSDSVSHRRTNVLYALGNYTREEIRDREGEKQIEFLIENAPTAKIFDFIYNEGTADSVYFFDKGTGEIIGTFPQRGKIRRNREFLRGSAQYNSQIQLPKNAMGTGNRRWFRRQLLPYYEDVMYLIGRTKGVRFRKGTRGTLLQEYQDNYASVGTPRSLVGHLIVESNLRPDARNRFARGIAQIGYRSRAGKKDQALAREMRKFGIVYEWWDAETQSTLAAAGLNVEAKLHGSWMGGLQAYHSGGINNARLMINGETALSNATRIAQYVAGLQVTTELPKKYRFSFGKWSGWYTSQVAGAHRTVQEIVEEVPQTHTYTYHLRRGVTLNDFMKITGMNKREARFYNPHLFKRVVQGGILHTPFPVPQLGTELEYCSSSEEAQGVLGAWDQLTFDEWDDDAVKKLNFFAEEFARVNCPAMTAAIKVFGVPFLGAVSRSRRGGSVQDTLQRYENDPGRKARAAKIASDLDNIDSLR